MKIEKVIKNMIVKVMKKRFVKYFLLDVKCVSGVSCKTNKNENSSLFCMHLFYANYFMKISCFKSLKKSSKQSIFSTGLQACEFSKSCTFLLVFSKELDKKMQIGYFVSARLLWMQLVCGVYRKKGLY